MPPSRSSSAGFFFSTFHALRSPTAHHVDAATRDLCGGLLPVWYVLWSSNHFVWRLTKTAPQSHIYTHTHEGRSVRDSTRHPLSLLFLFLPVLVLVLSGNSFPPRSAFCFCAGAPVHLTRRARATTAAAAAAAVVVFVWSRSHFFCCCSVCYRCLFFISAFLATRSLGFPSLSPLFQAKKTFFPSRGSLIVLVRVGTGV